MAKPLVVTISHDLGKTEAKRRLSNGLEYLQANHANKIAVLRNSWAGDSLSFEVATLGQHASGTVEVRDNDATLTVALPLLLAMLADKAKSLIQKEGRLLLEKK